MKSRILTLGVLGMVSMAASGVEKLPVEVGNVHKGDHMLYCQMNDAGPAWTAYASSEDGIEYNDLLQGDSIFSDKLMAPIEGRTRDAFICRPQHGSFMRITKEEYDRLKKWSDNAKSLFRENSI